MSYRVLELSQGFVAIVDAKHFRRVNRYSWHVHVAKGRGRKAGLPYARATINGKKIYLHRFIVDAPADMHVDHKNWQSLDCREENLLILPPVENMKRKRCALHRHDRQDRRDHVAV